MPDALALRMGYRPEMIRRWILVLSLLGACGGEGGTPDASRDAAITTDAAAAVDAGADGGDAGLDAGVDGGLDAGAAGMDAGMDAGAMGDAGGCVPTFVPVAAPVAPPFGGTSFVTDDLITASDPSSFQDLSYRGTGTRTMFDRRTAAFEEVEAHLFDAVFGARTGKVVEIQVNPEFTRAEAETHARHYAEVVGRIPSFLFRDIDTFWIHAGTNPFGGGNRNLLIHTGMGVDYEARGSLEEIFVHEASHTSMDAYHASADEWLAAVGADGAWISTYARDNPGREDVAETVGPFLALRFRSERVDASTLSSIESSIPNRLRYLDCQGLTMDILP